MSRQDMKCCIFLFTLLAVCYAAEPSHEDTNETIECDLSRRTIEPTRDFLCESREERPFDSDVRVARVKLEEIQVILIVTLFIMIVVLAKLGKTS